MHTVNMYLKFLFDRIVSFIGLLFLWPILLIVAILVKIKMPGGPAFFVQKRVGKDGKLFKCHKFRTMTMMNTEELFFLNTDLHGLDGRGFEIDN